MYIDRLYQPGILICDCFSRGRVKSQMPSNRAMGNDISVVESEKVLRKAFEQAPDAILVVNRAGEMERVNEQACSMFGYLEEELIGKPVELLIPDRFRKKHPEYRESYMGNPHIRSMAAGLDLYGKHKDGAEIPVDIMLSPLETENAEYVIAVVRDITDRRKMEQERERLTQQREDFVATLTHDLKTPILAANRVLKLLLEGDFGELMEQQRALIETILDSNSSMYNMVRTLLDVYKYESGTKSLTVDLQDISKLVKQVISDFSYLYADRGIELSANLPETLTPVSMDEEEIRRVFNNLIGNALKFTDENGSVRIEVSQADNETKVLVIDTGRGIADSDKVKLFQRFWQSSQQRKYYASTGLGLYLCRRIIELHGGSIWCESELGKGSTFGFTIPTQGIVEVK